MSASEVIRSTVVDETIAVITLDRPPHNLLDAATLSALADELDRVERADNLRVTVLAAAGKTFSGGADLGSSDASAGEFYGQALRLFAHPKPIVAAVQGAAVGGGLGVALVADFRVAAPEARFAANFTRLGIHHGFGLSVTLPLIVGHQAAREMLLAGRSVLGEDAKRIGLCDRLVPLENVEHAAIELAEEIASAAPLAVEAVRATLRADLLDRIGPAIEREREEQARLLGTDDFREGVAAMKERRDPKFGRS